MKATVHFRNALHDDAQMLLDLERSVASKTYSTISTLEQAINYISSQQIIFLFKGDELIGKVSYKKENSGVHIDGLIVVPEFRHKGYGELMVKHVMSLFPDTTLVLTVHPMNLCAVALYKKLGFSIVKEIPDYFGDGEPRVIMQIDI